VDVTRETLRRDDRLVLCSDGLTRHAADEEILQIAVGSEPELAAKRLVALANQRSGSDNISVGVLELSHTTITSQRPAGQSPEPGAATPPVIQARSRDRFAMLQEMSQSINSSLDLADTLRSVMDSLVAITGAERGFVMLLDENSGQLEFQIGRNVNATAVARDQEISRNIVGQVFRDRKPLLIGDAVADPEYRAFDSVMLHALRSVMCAPLMVKGAPIGVVYVDNSLSAELFDQDDLDLVTAFANIAASALENARLHERLADHVREIESMKTAQDRILRSVSSGIISLDRDGVVTSLNRAAAEMLAISAEQVVGRPLATILPPRFMLALGPPLAGQGIEPGMTIQGFEMEGDLQGRGWVHFRHRLSPLRDEGGENIGYVLVLDDMTERERLDRERRQAAAEREKIKSVFEHFMAPAIFEELMRLGPDKSGIGGDRRDLTVVFADIRGFTKLSEQLDPEHVVEILNSYLSSATDVVFEHQGTIDKFIGDAIMALFGAPVQIPNHPVEAVKAAVAMQRRFLDTPPRQGQRVSFGIGINTGPGIVGSIGAQQLMSYTVIGDVVNVAARLQSEARAGEILISGETYALVHELVRAEELGPMHLKGRFAPVNVYKVTGLRR
jgi:adenylate cyclase